MKYSCHCEMSTDCTGSQCCSDCKGPEKALLALCCCDDDVLAKSIGSIAKALRMLGPNARVSLDSACLI